MYTGWGESRAQMPSPYGVGGETGYIAQEDLKSVNRYNMGEGRTIRVWFFIPVFQDHLWFYLLFCPWVTIVIICFLSSFYFLCPCFSFLAHLLVN